MLPSLVVCGFGGACGHRYVLWRVLMSGVRGRQAGEDVPNKWNCYPWVSRDTLSMYRVLCIGHHIHLFAHSR